MALDTIFTSPTYNAYSTIAKMNELMDFKKMMGYNIGGWDTLTDPQKELFIIEATKHVDTLDWTGQANPLIVAPYRTQPRNGWFDAKGTPIPDDVVQEQIIELMSCWIVATMMDAKDSSTNSAGIKKKKVGDVEVEYLTSDKSGSFISDSDACASKHIPSDWYISHIVLGGIGTVGMTRNP